jgi:hypothetical protein
MNMAKITCPKCHTDGFMSLLDPIYRGPYRCWKCRENFLISMRDNELTSCESMTQEEFDRFKAEKSQHDRMKR